MKSGFAEDTLRNSSVLLLPPDLTSSNLNLPVPHRYTRKNRRKWNPHPKQTAIIQNFARLKPGSN
eukprot:scaffold1194_cov127-Cylindrotheca_fusiformis.AAC.15